MAHSPTVFLGDEYFTRRYKAGQIHLIADRRGFSSKANLTHAQP